ncbi:MAG: hypothetical protein AAFQ37_07185 [Bacteroidota bacterium]
MQRLSSNATLFLKIFLPVFWTTIVAMATLVLWFGPEQYFGGLPLQSLRWAMLLILLAGTATFILFFWPLKRVEADGEYIYVSNYFKTARYAWDKDVSKIHEQRFFLLRIGILELNGRGTFGQRIHFLLAKKLLIAFQEKHPDVM